ncbi:site-specific recombinase resolvase [Methylolobus aquaticus]|nr:site-specific recombinase resolvase [Methylolobus aquaticus]
MNGPCPAQSFVPFQLRRSKGRLVDTERTGHEPVLLEAIGRALHWQALLEAGAVASHRELAHKEGLHWSTVNKLLTLALLSPDLIEQCLAGRQPRTLTLRWLQRHRLPNDWPAQREVIDRFE